MIRNLIGMLEKENYFGITNILEMMGHRAKPAATVLVKSRLRGDFDDDKIFTVLGVETATLVPAISEELKSNHVEVRLHAAEWLATMGIKAKAATPALLQGLQQGLQDGPKKVESERPRVASNGWSSPSSISACDDEEKAWLAGLNALRAIGVESPKLLPSLIRVLSDNTRSGECRIAVLNALRQLGKQSKEATPVVLKFFVSDKQPVKIRTTALQTLEEIGIESRQLVPALIEAIQKEMDDNPTHNWCCDDLPRAALTYLARLRPQPKEGMPVLIRAFEQYKQDPALRVLLAQALGEWGPAAEEILPALREACKAPNRDLRKAAEAAFEKISVKGPK